MAKIKWFKSKEKVYGCYKCFVASKPQDMCVFRSEEKFLDHINRFHGQYK